MFGRHRKLFSSNMHILPLLLVIFLRCADSKFESKAEYLAKLIETEIEKANNFVLPTDARIYEPTSNDTSIEDFGEYDFVIVGAGPTGTVIANRLSEVESWNILLLEAGAFGNDFTDIPAYGSTVASSSFNWGYMSIPQKTACLAGRNQSCSLPKGRGVGGSSLLNGLVYSRGHPLDYDKWAELGNPGWSFEEVLPYFKKSEDFRHSDKEAPVDFSYHGTGGYHAVEYNMPRSTQLNEFLEANRELGYNITDYNSLWEIGASPTQLNTKNGKRADCGTAFIKPILSRKNLEVMTNSYATKLHFEGNKCVGVYFSHNKKIYEARVRKEAILSAGALGSPQLLMLSGVGPKQHLQDVGIPLVQDLEVGSVLRQHSMYYGLTFSSNLSAPARPFKDYIDEYLNGYGPLTSNGPNSGVGFYQTPLEKTPNYPDLELMFFPANSTATNLKWLSSLNQETYEATWKHTDVTSSFLIYPANLHQYSVGSVRLGSSSPYEYPVVDTNYLSDPDDHDINVLYEGIKLSLALIETKPFRRINATLQVKPLPACKEFEAFSKDYWFCTLRHLTFDVFHPMSTCQMGPDPKKGAVVNHLAKVHGLMNVRVADASIFPFTISGHTSAPCVMIGEKVSDLIKLDYISKFRK
ncbi:glucose dehydrogenase [FAD, quinone] [Leptinotarsa decemlineata]|uniref:glucose dehydrogenase [FAD, quinone] n=1 Tax=Leptinotarsa decemlineata TaxID=7539 RepID=UPI003D3081A6